MPGTAERLKVAIVGGGCAGLTTAFELTQPELGGRYEVTVYQMGFRLGGKGASGRGVSGRIEEHGLHLWMGYYENAFRLMRDCYAELGRDESSCPIANFEQAFLPANANAAADWSPAGEWLLWNVEFPPLDGLPGDLPARSWSVADYLVRAAALVRTLFATLAARSTPDEAAAKISEATARQSLPDWVSRLASFGKLAGLGLAVEALRFLEGALSAIGTQSQSGLLSVIDGVYAIARRELTALVQSDDQLRRLWEIADITLATLRGAVQFRLALDPRGFDAIDQYDSRKWLLLNGASRASVDSAFIRGLYDLAFAYADGDPNRPSFSAGAALRGSLRAFFTYRGAFFWKMSSGMGDIVFAPLYEVLKRRGVRFEFFHRLESVQLNPVTLTRDNSNSARPSRWVRGLELSVQAELKPGLTEYDPLVEIKGLPCWPAQARYEQLENGEQLRERGVDFEAPWEERISGRKTLQVGRDFDMVVLAVGLGAVPHLCKEILEQDDRWQAMIEHVKSVPTQAFQLWLDVDRSALGRPGPASNVSGFVEPFDTWADMTHVAKTEAHAIDPKSIAYFCNVLPRPALPRAATADGWAEWYAEQARAVRSSAVQFLERDVGHLWPGAMSAGRFRWELLTGDGNAESAEHAVGAEAFTTQFWTANVRPSDAYTQALPGTARYRISPLEGSYKNLTIAGDWTQCGLNMGCVEAAVMSGRLASHAISQHPPLEKIVGYDHP
jgi:uncharacterized protein with NAD-binding domain and iron-sulfur cluster